MLGKKIKKINERSHLFSEFVNACGIQPVKGELVNMLKTQSSVLSQLTMIASIIPGSLETYFVWEAGFMDLKRLASNKISTNITTKTANVLYQL